MKNGTGLVKHSHEKSSSQNDGRSPWQLCESSKEVHVVISRQKIKAI